MRTRIEGIGCEIEVVNKAGMLAYGESGLRSYQALVLAGGFAASAWTEASKALMMEQLAGNSEALKELSEKPNGPYIIVLAELAEKLPEAEQRALLLHEEGHIVHGDLDGVDHANLDPKKIKLVLNKEGELKADRYAADRVGAEVVSTALRHILMAQAELIGEMTSMSSEEYLGLALNDPLVKDRLEALAA